MQAQPLAGQGVLVLLTTVAEGICWQPMIFGHSRNQFHRAKAVLLDPEKKMLAFANRFKTEYFLDFEVGSRGFQNSSGLRFTVGIGQYRVHQLRAFSATRLRR